MSHHTSNNSHKPPAVRHLPDPAICRGRIVIHDSVECLVPSPADCHYALEYGGAYLCHHPDRADIAKRTKAKKITKKK